MADPAAGLATTNRPIEAVRILEWVSERMSADRAHPASVALGLLCVVGVLGDQVSVVAHGVFERPRFLWCTDSPHSCVEPSELVVARIGGTASDEVAAVEVTFSDGRTVAVEPQSSAQNPGWNFWYLEASVTADEGAPIDQVVQSVVALDASGEVVSSIEAT